MAFSKHSYTKSLYLQNTTLLVLPRRWLSFSFRWSFATKHQSIRRKVKTVKKMVIKKSIRLTRVNKYYVTKESYNKSYNNDSHEGVRRILLLSVATRNAQGA